jgi:hypothetical protein
MVKDIIFFNKISLFQQCELEARKNGLKKAQDYIIQTVENYFTQKNPEKIFKKPMDLWIALDDESRCMGMKIADLIEKICDETLNPKPISHIEPKKEGLFQKIGDAISLPRV